MASVHADGVGSCASGNRTSWWISWIPDGIGHHRLQWWFGGTGTGGESKHRVDLETAVLLDGILAPTVIASFVMRLEMVGVGGKRIFTYGLEDRAGVDGVRVGRSRATGEAGGSSNARDDRRHRLTLRAAVVR